MRQIGLSDLDAATRMLLAAPHQDWPEQAQRVIEQAHFADHWRKRFGSPHPTTGGTGSLYAQAILYPRADTSFCDPQYCAALAVVLEALQRWRQRGSGA